MVKNIPGIVAVQSELEPRVFSKGVKVSATEFYVRLNNTAWELESVTVRVFVE